MFPMFSDCSVQTCEKTSILRIDFNSRVEKTDFNSRVEKTNVNLLETNSYRWQTSGLLETCGDALVKK